ncbi:MAG: cation:proton antiporter [Candidatus Nomurabacteria bacterium]|nr:MAG: cation:proton antiporter [Candidatus Nomurabacteria bacterium]
MSIYLFLSVVFLFTLLVGRLIERVKVPWVFAALILGTILAIGNPFSTITNGETFSFLAQLGMYLLLFIIGFEVDVQDMRKKGAFLASSAFVIILFEALLGSILVHTLFQVSWDIAILVGLSFATVGEAILVPILDASKLIRTPVGQAIIGIGTLDDIVEIISLIFVSLLLGTSAVNISVHVAVVFLGLLGLFGLTALFSYLRAERQRFAFSQVETLFLMTMFGLFLFLAVGSFAEATALGALLAGVALRNFIPTARLKFIETDLRTIAYGFFAPIFFVWVGASLDLQYVGGHLWQIAALIVVAGLAKLLASIVMGKKEFGGRGAILLGIGLSVRFSTSIIIVKLLFDNGLIDVGLYSVIIASTICFTLLIPFLFAQLSARWRNQLKTK